MERNTPRATADRQAAIVAQPCAARADMTTVVQSLQNFVTAVGAAREMPLRPVRCESDGDWRCLTALDVEQHTLRSWGYPRPDAIRAAHRYLRERGYRPRATLAAGVSAGTVYVAVRDIGTSVRIMQSLWPTLARLLTTCSSAIRDDTEHRGRPTGIAQAKIRRWDPRTPGTRWSYVGGLDPSCGAAACSGHWGTPRTRR